jgi:hypothetical protein
MVVTPVTHLRDNSMDRSFRSSGLRRWLIALGLGITGAVSIAPVQGQELCGGVDYPFPYTDVSGVAAAFCPGIMEAYVTGISKGTTPTTFSPNNTVTRVQMTTFLQRSLDQGTQRANRNRTIWRMQRRDQLLGNRRGRKQSAAILSSVRAPNRVAIRDSSASMRLRLPGV